MSAPVPSEVEVTTPDDLRALADEGDATTTLGGASFWQPRASVALRGAADRIEKLEAGLRLIQNMTDHADLLNDLETRARIGVIHADARALLGEGTAPDEEKNR